MKKYPTKSWIHPGIRLANSSTHGKGMFAKTLLKKGEVLVIWGAKYVNKKEADKARLRGKLIMHLDRNLYSIEDRGDDPTYFINHSCDPNMWMKDAVTIIARRNIKKGEELRVDYALFEGDKSYRAKWKCICGSSLCRKNITGNDWKLPELQKRYKNHFIPLINKRLKN